MDISMWEVVNMVRIGIFDKETEYVTRLCAYLNRYGKGIWSVSAFTETDSLSRYMSDKRIDMLVATDKGILVKMKEEVRDMCYVCLSEEREHRDIGTDKHRIYMVYRYQSAKLIGDTLRDIVEYLGMLTRTGKNSVVIYSPVGRCGKTTLAMRFAGNVSGGKWLYVGMEDYGGKTIRNDHSETVRSNEKTAYEENVEYSSLEERADDFLYYLKERNKQGVLNIINQSHGVIPSAFSLFDTRLVNREDIRWFLEMFEKVVEYRGVIFDMGTGILNDFNVLSEFKYVVVPFVNDSISIAKRKQFEELAAVYEPEGMADRIKYIDMTGGTPVEELRKMLE